MKMKIIDFVICTQAQTHNISVMKERDKNKLLENLLILNFIVTIRNEKRKKKNRIFYFVYKEFRV